MVPDAPTLCRSCGAPLRLTLADLGPLPVARSGFGPGPGAAPHGLATQIPMAPVHAQVCEACWLCQVAPLPAGLAPRHDNDVTLSSFIPGRPRESRRHARRMMDELRLGPRSRVLEIGSNDGCLLQYFHGVGVGVLGIEPSGRAAAAAIAQGVATRVESWSADLAEDLRAGGLRPDLVTSANVLNELPDLDDALGGVAGLLHGDAVFTAEFPHLPHLLGAGQFDALHHDNLNHLSLLALAPVYARAGLRLFDAEALPAEGGSLRLWACRPDARHAERPGLAAIRAEEAAAGLDTADAYRRFAPLAREARDRLADFLMSAHHGRKTVAAFGATARGNALLNYCGATEQTVAYCIDPDPAREGTCLPGSGIPVFDPSEIDRRRPDFMLILPWRRQTEIIADLFELRRKGTRFVTALPDLSVIA